MLRLHNTLTKKTEAFQPLEKGRVGMYVCGPTVYGPGHIGHARTYIAFDVIRRYLEYRGFKVAFIMNITDVHDDMIKTAKEQNTSIFELAEKNIPLFFKDMEALGIKPADAYPRVTDFIPEIVSMIKDLKEKGLAYETDDGVYFPVARFKGYGKLSGAKVSASKTGTRVETDKYEKAEAHDFALWKKARPGEPFWKSPWGNGRPGWHIECSVLSQKHLGKQLDVHGGAVDLVFPHHENEIAQSEGASGLAPFVRYWLHTGFLNVHGEKMSKSLGNFIELPQLLEKHDAKDFRFLIASIHYRSRIDFSEQAMQTAREGRAKINECIQKLLDAEAGAGGNEDDAALRQRVDAVRAYVEEAMDNDFNAPNAFAALFEWVRELNAALASGTVSAKDAKHALQLFRDIDFFLNVLDFSIDAEPLPPELQKLVDEREKLRAAKKWAEADRLRAKLLEKGVALMDTADGVKWRRVR